MKPIFVAALILALSFSACRKNNGPSADGSPETGNLADLQAGAFDFPNEFEETGDAGEHLPDGLQFVIENNSSVTITEYTGTGKTLVIPGTIQGLPVTAIGDGAFRWTDLSSITIPASVTLIENWPFTDNEQLTDIIVDSDNPAFSDIGGVLFDKSGRNIVQYPYGRQDAAYAIPSSVTAIGNMAFAGNLALTKVTIPPSVTSIGVQAFIGSGLEHVTVSPTVRYIGNRAFDGCRGLTAIEVDDGNPAYASLDGVMFDKGMETLLQYPAGREDDEYIIPSSVTAVGALAFNIAQITGVVIPSSVTSIGEYAFYYTPLTNVVIPPSVASVGRMAFFGSELTGVTISRQTTVGRNAFPRGTVITYSD